MALFDAAEIKRIKGKYYDPANPITQVYYKNPECCVRLHLAIVDDNQDPDGYGRRKLQFPQWGSNVVSSWVPLTRPCAGSGGGVWALPEVGGQVVEMKIVSGTAQNTIFALLGYTIFLQARNKK